ncbi:MAG: TolC family protein [Muribaculaceae bacterium]|nr:TolC family protein [Muribaculaceae bacterium]
MKIEKIFCHILFWLFLPLPAFADMTIEECVGLALENYPLASKYNTLTSFKEIELSDINKVWLPRIETYAQGTGQNIVPSYPESLKNVLQQMGNDVKGLSNYQYKIGFDINQTIWDGGVSKIRREMENAKDELDKASLDVELYPIRDRVENLYFAILLTDEQISINEQTYSLLLANLDRFRSMVRNGVAMQCDADMVEAQAMIVKQNMDLAKKNVETLRLMLGILTGKNLEGERLLEPQVKSILPGENLRPELTLLEKRMALNALSDKMTEVSLMPKIGLFAQAYYGYPGFNYFESMMNRRFSFNLLAGVKISWNIDSFYFKKNNLRKIKLSAENITAEKDIFLFNTRISATQQNGKAQGLYDMIESDKKIIELRVKVRKAAESQLENGVIDATTLLAKISDENIAKLNERYHKIDYIREYYKLKYTLNQ